MVSKLKIERVKKELTQHQLWMKTDIPQWRISLIERGVPPTPDERRKLAKALGIPESSLELPISEKENCV